jgi:general secretion pathway protein B
VARPTPPAPRKPARTEAGTAPAAAAAPPLPRMSDLPEDLRRQVPTLTFGGSVHSPMPAQRMVIFNGQVLREGDTVAEGLTVEEIRAKSAVLRIRGQRFEIVF